MKLNNRIRVPALLTLALVWILLLTTAILPVSAKEKTTTWNYDVTSRTLTATFPDGTTTVYYRVESTPHLRTDPLYSYRYQNTAIIDGNGYTIYSSEWNRDILAAGNGENEWIFFATAERLPEVEALYAGQMVNSISLSYLDRKEYRHSELKRFILRDLQRLTEDPNAQVLTGTTQHFRYAPHYELWCYDMENMVAVNRGFFFDLEGYVYFIPIEDVPPAALDERGLLLPSEDLSLTLYLVPQEHQDTLLDAIHYANPYHIWSFTEEEDVSITVMDPSRGIATVTVVILGILLPIVPLVIGLCFPRSARMGHKKRWYILSILGGAWMLLGILQLVILTMAL